MMGKKQIQDLEDTLGAAAVALPRADGEDRLHFHTEFYPYLMSVYEKAKVDVAKLGMTELVEITIRDCMTMVNEGRRKEAQDMLYATSSALSEKSGTWDEMRRMYTASNDASAK
jgi:hypothetical protein